MSKQQILPFMNSSRDLNRYSGPSGGRLKEKDVPSEDLFGSMYHSLTGRDSARAEKNSPAGEKLDRTAGGKGTNHQQEMESAKSPAGSAQAGHVHEKQSVEPGDERKTLSDNMQANGSTDGNSETGKNPEEGKAAVSASATNQGSAVNQGMVHGVIQEAEGSAAVVGGEGQTGAASGSVSAGGTIQPADLGQTAVGRTVSADAKIAAEQEAGTVRQDNNPTVESGGMPGKALSGETQPEVQKTLKSLLRSAGGDAAIVDDESKEKEPARASVTNKISSANIETGSGEKASFEEMKNPVETFLKDEKASHTQKSTVIAASVGKEQTGKGQEEKRLPSFAAGELRSDKSGEPGIWTGGRSARPFTQMDLNNSGSDLLTHFEYKSDEDELMWKQHSVESVEAKEGKAADQQRTFYMRLGQIPVSNVSIRRNLLPGLTQNVLKAANGTKASPETWQKHNFVLDDGKKVHLSARQVNGVLQLKIGSLHTELNKLLLQHQHQIREHLEQGCGLEVDLQFESQEEQGMTEFFDSSSFSKRDRHGNTLQTGGKATPQEVEQVLLKSVRKFGYNEMEWTA